MTRATRRACREKLGSDLGPALTTAQTVYDYLKADIERSPVVCVVSGGTQQQGLTFQGDKGVYNFQIIVFVARGANREQAAEDELDNVAEELYEYIETNPVVASYWQDLRKTETSEIIAVTPGGRGYWMETHYVALESY